MTARVVRWAVAAVLVAAPAWAGMRAPAGMACPKVLTVPSGEQGTPALVQNAASILGVSDASGGVIRCTTFVSPCTGTFTAIGFNAQAASAGSQSDVGIYTSTKARLGSTGPISTGNTGNKTLTSGVSISLVSGLSYLACWSSSVNTGVQLTASIPNNALNNWMAPVNVAGGVVAQFNDNCTGAGSPYACCSGTDTGTCTGLPASFTTTTTSTTDGAPAIVLGR